MDQSLGIAFGAGMLATVSPCGLAMLPGFLAYYIGVDTGAPGDRQVLRRSSRALRTGVLVSVGFVTVFLGTALVVTAGLRSVLEAVPWLAVAVGFVLVAVGLVMLAGRRVGVALRFNPLRSGGRGPLAMLSYGAAYAIASLSCALGALLALIGGGLTTTTTTGLLGTFAAFAAGSTTILVLLALSAGLASGGLVKTLQRSSRYVTQVAGGIVVLSGIYMVSYWTPALSGGSSNRSLAGEVMPVTGAIHDFFEAHTGALGVLAVATIVLVLALAARSARCTPANTREGDEPASKDAARTH